MDGIDESLDEKRFTRWLERLQSSIKVKVEARTWALPVGGGCVEMNSFVWPSFSVFLELFFKFSRVFRVFERKCFLSCYV